jgi:hypothetical protein
MMRSPLAVRFEVLQRGISLKLDNGQVWRCGLLPKLPQFDAQEPVSSEMLAVRAQHSILCLVRLDR